MSNEARMFCCIGMANLWLMAGELAPAIAWIAASLVFVLCMWQETRP